MDIKSRRALIDEVASPQPYRSAFNTYRRFSNMATQTPTTSSKRIHYNDGDDDGNSDNNEDDNAHARHFRHQLYGAEGDCVDVVHRYSNNSQNITKIYHLPLFERRTRGRHVILSSTARYYRKNRHMDLAAKYSSI